MKGAALLKQMRRDSSRGLGKKGSVDQMNLVLAIMIGLFAFAGVLIGLQEFRGTITDNTTPAWQSINNSLAMGENFTVQLPTVGTLAGVVLLIAVIVGGILSAIYVKNNYF